jgi:hypothetical protein
MNYHTAVEQAIHDLRAAHDPDGDAVRAALQLAVHAWQHCDQPTSDAARWAMFGTGLGAAIDELTPPGQPFIILIDEQQLPDTEQVRQQTAALAAAVADRLETAAGNPHADPARRWAWSTAAARLYTAADDLVSWP